MKKHIIIAGVPRAGKSTVSQFIAHKYGYQHISMDSIIAGIEKTFPETGINSDAAVPVTDNLACISAKMGPFLRAMMDSGEYDELDYGMVIDIYQLLPKDYIQYIDPSICDIYYFLTSDVTPEERYQILKTYDTPKDYTYYHSDEENRESCISMVEVSKLFKDQCQKFGLPYYETAVNRPDVIHSFLQSLEKQK